MSSTCPICERRRGKRFCPGLARSRWGGSTETICAPCCGEQREVSIDCPAHCPYLIAAHRYEVRRGAGKRAAGPLAFENVVIAPDFVGEKRHLIAALIVFLVDFASQHPEVHDPEVLAALDGLARGYQTLNSGLYYEQPPESPAAAALYAAAQSSLNHYSEEQQKRTGSSLRPIDVLRALVFLRRVGQLEGNGRPLSRRYLESLRRQVPAQATAADEPRLIVPGS